MSIVTQTLQLTLAWGHNRAHDRIEIVEQLPNPIFHAKFGKEWSASGLDSARIVEYRLYRPRPIRQCSLCSAGITLNGYSIG